MNGLAQRSGNNSARDIVASQKLLETVKLSKLANFSKLVTQFKKDLLKILLSASKIPFKVA